MITIPIFKFVINDKEKSHQIEKDQSSCAALMGKRIGESFPGALLGLNNYTLEVTGGTDKCGFPMRKDIEGSVRKRYVIKDKARRKKMLRGNTINKDIVQINCKVLEKGDKDLEEVTTKLSTKED